jgi:hypothetical protein
MQTVHPSRFGPYRLPIHGPRWPTLIGASRRAAHLAATMRRAGADASAWTAALRGPR